MSNTDQQLSMAALESGDSDWEATNDNDDVPSVDGSDDSVSIGSTSSESGSESDDNGEQAPEPVVEKPKPQKKSLKKASGKLPKTGPEKKGKAPDQKKIKPVVVKQEEDAYKSMQKPNKKLPAVKIVKYNPANVSGIAGRPIQKNIRIVTPAGHVPSEYPSVKAFRENPPKDPKQFFRADMSGRNQSSYRAFCVKQLSPPHNVTYFVLSSKDSDADSLAKCGLAIKSCSTKTKALLAQAAVLQHKKSYADAEKVMLKIDSGTRKALGWSGDGESKEPHSRPAIIGFELAQELQAAAAACAEPQSTKKRPRSDTASQTQHVAKRFAQDLQDLVGARITKITMQLDLVEP